MKKVIGILLLVIAIVLIVLGLKTQETPENVAIIEDTTVEGTEAIEDTNSDENLETNEPEVDNSETQESEVTEEEVGTDLPIAEENINATDEDIDTEGSNTLTIEDGSQVLRLGKKIGGQHNGYIEIIEGSLQQKDGSIIGGNIVFDMNSIKATDIDNEGLDDHLKSEEYFNAENYPRAELTIKKVETDGTTTADLNMNGVSKTITFPASIEQNENQVIVYANFALDRTMRNINGGLPAVSKYMEITLENLTFTQQ